MIIHMLTHPLLLPVTFSLVAGLVCLLIPRFATRMCAWVAVGSAAWVLWLVWSLFQNGPAVFDPVPWLSFRVDALSAFILLAVAFFTLLIAIFSIGYMKRRDRQREYFAYLLWTLGISCAAVLANDLLVLLVCWGFLALMLYLMISLTGPAAADAARKSLMVIGGSDALLLFGIVLYWSLSGSLRMDGHSLPIDSPASTIAFLMFLCAAFAKAGAVPFHTWVPDFGEKADAPVSAFLPASLDKLLGIYLLARCVLDLFILTPMLYVLLMALGAITVITAVMQALVQHDLKRLLSYHAVSQVGYMVLGIGTGTAIGLAGGLFHMINNTIYKSALFLCAGVVENEVGTTDLDRLGGLARLLPVTFIACTVAALSIAGVPPLNGFASKWMIYQGIIESREAGGPGWILWLAVAMLGSALTLASFVKVLHATFLCKPSPEVKRVIESRGIRERERSMLLPLVILAGLCVVFGVFAFQVPLAQLILPISDLGTRIEVAGVWWAGMASLLILGAIGIGLVVYLLTMRSGKLRRVQTYIGGEHLQDAYIKGEAEGPGRHIDVTGVDFYKTIEQLPVLKRLYVLARAKVFDIYHLLEKGMNYPIILLRSMHTGILPAYLRWFVVGLLAVVWMVTQTGI